MSPFDLQQPFTINADAQFKRGILMLDDCEGTSKWVGSGDGSDFGVAYHTDAAIFGTNGLQLLTKLTTPAEDDQVVAEKYVTYPETDLLMVRLRLRLPDITEVKRFTLHTQFHNGTSLITAGIGYNFEDNAMSYYNDAGGWTAIAGYGQTQANGFTTIMELVLDQGRQEYISVLFMGLRTDLTGIGYYTSGASTLKDLYLQFLVDALIAQQAEIHVDSIYVGEIEQL